MTLAQAARFLRLASFGGRPGEIADVARIGPEAWLDRQMSAPRLDRFMDFLKRGGPVNGTWRAGQRRPHLLFESCFWMQAVFGADQLRQRMAFALSQILVVSSEEQAVTKNAMMLAHYGDILYDHALGNYRDLLTAVSTSPAMGVYLTFLGNMKADPSGARQPDENYAREVMQLFTIGLWQLEEDGSHKKDANGEDIPTYGPDEISAMARVFTGWGFGGGATTDMRWKGGHILGDRDYRWENALIPYDRYHDRDEKIIVDGVRIAKGTRPEAAMRITLDTLFEHPNTPPFIARQLIQRLVTSNPSPGYIARVAQVFKDNGAGVRGDLSAVARAILLDAEALGPAEQFPQRGRMREPVLRLAQWMRLLADRDAMTRQNLAHDFSRAGAWIGQRPFNAPSVFNWYTPDDSPAGPIKRSGLVAPEFNLHDVSGILSYCNGLMRVFASPLAMHEHLGAGADSPVDKAIIDSPADLTAWVDLHLCAGQMARDTRDTLIEALRRVSGEPPVERIKTAVYLAMISPAYFLET